MSFRKILIAVDESAFATRAADVGFDLARSLGVEVAIIHVVDPAVDAYAPEGGISLNDLVTLAQQDGRRRLAAFGQRAGLQSAPHEFLHVGKSGARCSRRRISSPKKLPGQSNSSAPAQTAVETLSSLGTAAETGLATAVATARLTEAGPNEVPERPDHLLFAWRGSSGAFPQRCSSS